MSQDNKDFTLEDILAEQRAQREIEAAQRAAQHHEKKWCHDPVALSATGLAAQRTSDGAGDAPESLQARAGKRLSAPHHQVDVGAAVAWCSIDDIGPVAAGAAADRLAGFAAAAAGPLCAAGRQRLLGAPGGDWPPDRGRGRPGAGPGVLQRRPGRRPSPDLGPTPNPVRPRSCRRRPAPNRRWWSTCCLPTGSPRPLPRRNRRRARRHRAAPRPPPRSSGSPPRPTFRRPHRCLQQVFSRILDNRIRRSNKRIRL